MGIETRTASVIGLLLLWMGVLAGSAQASAIVRMEYEYAPGSVNVVTGLPVVGSVSFPVNGNITFGFLAETLGGGVPGYSGTGMTATTLGTSLVLLGPVSAFAQEQQQILESHPPVVDLDLYGYVRAHLAGPRASYSTGGVLTGPLTYQTMGGTTVTFASMMGTASRTNMNGNGKRLYPAITTGSLAMVTVTGWLHCTGMGGAFGVSCTANAGVQPSGGSLMASFVQNAWSGSMATDLYEVRSESGQISVWYGGAPRIADASPAELYVFQSFVNAATRSAGPATNTGYVILLGNEIRRTVETVPESGKGILAILAAAFILLTPLGAHFLRR